MAAISSVYKSFNPTQHHLTYSILTLRQMTKPLRKKTEKKDYLCEFTQITFSHFSHLRIVVQHVGLCGLIRDEFVIRLGGIRERLDNHILRQGCRA